MSLMERGSVGNGNFVIATIGLLDTEEEPELTVLPFSGYSKKSVRRFMCGQGFGGRRLPT